MELLRSGAIANSSRKHPMKIAHNPSVTVVWKAFRSADLMLTGSFIIDLPFKKYFELQSIWLLNKNGIFKSIPLL